MHARAARIVRKLSLFEETLMCIRLRCGQWLSVTDALAKHIAARYRGFARQLFSVEL